MNHFPLALREVLIPDTTFRILRIPLRFNGTLIKINYNLKNYIVSFSDNTNFKKYFLFSQFNSESGSLFKMQKVTTIYVNKTTPYVLWTTKSVSHNPWDTTTDTKKLLGSPRLQTYTYNRQTLCCDSKVRTHQIKLTKYWDDKQVMTTSILPYEAHTWYLDFQIYNFLISLQF